MSKHLGDFKAGDVIYGKFSTIQPSTSEPFALSSGAISVYKNNSTTQSTAGVTLTASFDGVTGFNHYTIDTSADGSFYADGGSFDIMLSAGTVDGVSVAGRTIASFTLRRATLASNAVDDTALAADAVTAIQSGLATSAQIGVAGAALTDIPWNTDWDTEVEGNATAALVAYDGPTHAELVSEINAVQTDISNLNDISAAQVNAEVLDVLTVDTFGEITGVPPDTTTILNRIRWVFQEEIYRVDTGINYRLVYNGAGVAQYKKVLDDSSGVFVETKVEAP